MHRAHDEGSRATVLATWADRSVFDRVAPTDAESDRFWDIVDAERLRLLAQRGPWARMRARLSLRSLLPGRRRGRG